MLLERGKMSDYTQRATIFVGEQRYCKRVFLPIGNRGAKNVSIRARNDEIRLLLQGCFFFFLGGRIFEIHFFRVSHRRECFAHFPIYKLIYFSTKRERPTDFDYVGNNSRAPHARLW